MALEKLSPEMERILVMRIEKVLTKARYYPAEVDPKMDAYRVIEPYVTRKGTHCEAGIDTV